MRIIKIDQTLINLTAAEQYSGDIDDVILQKLKSQLENTCDKNAFVIKVLEIIRRSSCYQTQSRLDGSADVSVLYKVDALIYNTGDVLVNAKIKNIERLSGDILCQHEHAVIKVKGSKIMQRLSKGQLIPIKINKIQYMKGSSTMTIFGTPYSYSFQCILYSIKMNSSITEEVTELIEMKIKALEDELSLYKEIEQEAKFFDELFYPFKDSFKPDQNSEFVLTDMLEFIKDILSNKLKNNVILMRHPRILKSTPFIYITNQDIFKKDSTDPLLDEEQYNIKIISDNIGNVIFKFLGDYLNHINLLRQMTETYNTEQKKKDHSDLWDIYNRIKR